MSFENDKLFRNNKSFGKESTLATELNLPEEPADLRLVARVLDLIDCGALVCERSGRIVFANKEARLRLPAEWNDGAGAEFLDELTGGPLEPILREIEKGATEIPVRLCGNGEKVPARAKWLRQPDWLIVTFQDPSIEEGEWLHPSQQGESLTWIHGKETEPQAASAVGIYQDRVSEDLLFLAASPQMAKIREQILRIAPVNVSVFLSGESGTGKDLLARMVHAYSERRDRPFIKVNCAALPGELLESELFGYEQGAFTGAVRQKPGKFEFANHGTIFLDEIAEMSSHLQSKLLHVLQDKQYTRLGGRNTIRVDVRVVAATNVDVQEAIAQGRLREDLYYRLSVVGLQVPPLRERPADILLLFRTALAKYQQEFGQPQTEPSASLLDLVAQHTWPGNVRELENFAKRYVVLGDMEGTIQELQKATPKEAPAIVSRPRGNGRQTLKSVVRHLKEEVEARAIAEALKQTNWCRKDAAHMLGISYKGLLCKIRQFGLEAENGKGGASQSPQKYDAKIVN